MKKHIYPLLLFLAAGCCQAECPTADVMVSFERFRSSDVDSVLTVRYRPGTHFTERLDSTWTYTPVAATDTSWSRLYKTIFGMEDTRIFLPSVNKTFRFTDFELESIRCPCNGGRTRVVRSFAVNGIRKEGTTAVLE